MSIKTTEELKERDTGGPPRPPGFSRLPSSLSPLQGAPQNLCHFLTSYQAPGPQPPVLALHLPSRGAKYLLGVGLGGAEGTTVNRREPCTPRAAGKWGSMACGRCQQDPMF